MKLLSLSNHACLAWYTFVSRTIGILTNVYHLMLKITQNHQNTQNPPNTLFWKSPSCVTLIYEHVVNACLAWYTFVSRTIGILTNVYHLMLKPPKITQNHQITINTLFWKTTYYFSFSRMYH